MKKDFSEYQYSEYDKYLSKRSNQQNMKLDLFTNKVAFFSEKKQFYVTVDNYWEPEFMQEIIDAVERERGIVSAELSPEDQADLEEDRNDDLKMNQEWYRHFQEKYNIVSNRNIMSEDDEYPTADTVNVLNGTTICLNYGEGILDFIYADFQTPLKKELQLYMLFDGFRETYKNDAQKPPSAEEPEKILNQDQLIADDFLAYEDTYRSIMDVANASLYSAICPPQFKGGAIDETKKLKQYGSYLLTLQKEFQEMIEFCYDEDYYPNLLGKLYPSERLNIYRRAHDLPSRYLRKEQLELSQHNMGGHEMPFGMPADQILERLKNFRFETTEEEDKFAAEIGISSSQLAAYLHHPTFMSITYYFGSIAQILELEFTKMMEQNVRFRKCKRCGKYFIMKGNYDTNYCDRIAEGETRTCQELAAIENYKAKIADDKSIPIYNRYYKRYAARLKVRQIKETDFKKWKYQAMAKRDECSAGTITPEEYTEWMEAAFPNRTPKNK